MISRGLSQPNLGHDYTFSDRDLCSLFCLSEQEMSAHAGLLTLKCTQLFVQYVAMKMLVNPPEAYSSSSGAKQPCSTGSLCISACLDTAVFSAEPSLTTCFTNQVSDQGSAGTGHIKVGFAPFPADVLLSCMNLPVCMCGKSWTIGGFRLDSK